MSHNFKRHFGQNFLVHQSTANKIASFISSDIKNVIEIGPGDGKLTQALLDKGFNVSSIEIDVDLYDKLEEKFQEYPNFKLIKGDVMQIDLMDLNIEHLKYAITGNLPYNISKPIIRKFLEIDIKPKEMLIMVQNEVADDYTAKVPNSKFLSNYSQIFSTVEYVYKVKKDQFKPKPKVDGGVIKFSFKSKVGVKDSAEFIKFLKQGFSAPRKTLTNALKNYDRKIIINILKNNNLTQKARSAELSFETWVELFENLR